MKRPVGILGGMGPAATVDLMSRVISAVDAEDDTDHIPLIVHQNSQVPSRIAALIEGRGADPGPVLAAMAADLERAGAVALAMPCNTAHHYAPRVRAATSLPFLDMVTLACAHAETVAAGDCVGILGSPALATVGVYDGALADLGLRAVYAADQDAALNLIRDIKANGPSPGAKDKLFRLANNLIDQGAHTICVACTEFSLMQDALAGLPIPCFDPIDLLVGAIIDASTSEIRPDRSSGPERPTVCDRAMVD